MPTFRNTLFHLHMQVGVCTHTPTCLWRWNRQSVPKRRHINFRRRGITQKKEYTIQNTAKVWNQEYFFIFLFFSLFMVFHFLCLLPSLLSAFLLSIYFFAPYVLSCCFSLLPSCVISSQYSTQCHSGLLDDSTPSLATTSGHDNGHPRNSDDNTSA